MKRTLMCGGLVLSAAAGQAFGQSLNIDFNRTSGSGAGAPAIAYAAQADLAGTWNAVLPTSAAGGATVGLVGLNGAATGVTLNHRATSGGGGSAYGSGEFSRLMADYAFAFGQNGNIDLKINGLEPGFYRAYIYAGLPPAEAQYTDSWGTWDHTATIGVTVGGLNLSTFSVSGATANGSLARGTNYVIANVRIPANSPELRILTSCDLGNSSAKAAVNGVQLLRWSGNVVYVRPGGAGLKTGQNWANALDNLQEAIDLAAASGGQVTQVWVAAGTYKPTTTTDRTKAFIMKDGVALYGGFSGVESQLSQRNVASNLTHLSGDIGTGRVSSDNSYQVIRCHGVTRSAVLDGFVVSGGNANGSGSTNLVGGGMHGNEASPTVRNCTFTANQAQVGGAVSIEWPQGTIGPIFTDCVFSNNSASEGGALRYTGRTDLSPAPYLTVVNTKFIRNTANNGGAVTIYDGDAYFLNTLFNGNSVTQSAGAMYVYGNSVWGDVDVTLSQCTVVHNTSDVFRGGLFGSLTADLIVSNCIFWGNDSVVDSGVGDHYTIGNTAATYSCVQTGSASAAPGTGNIAAHPAFTDIDGANNIPGDFDDDLTLANNSPCIDAGSNNAQFIDWTDLDRDGVTFEWLPLDLARNNRRFDVAFVADSGQGVAPIVDMGAYESQAVTCPADFNGDGFVDFFDFDDFVACFEGGACPPGKSADFNNDGFADFFDYDDFVLAFENGC